MGSYGSTCRRRPTCPATVNRTWTKSRCASISAPARPWALKLRRVDYRPVLHPPLETTRLIRSWGPEAVLREKSPRNLARNLICRDFALTSRSYSGFSRSTHPERLEAVSAALSFQSVGCAEGEHQRNSHLFKRLPRAIF
jgi:hypothetical protein